MSISQLVARQLKHIRRFLRFLWLFRRYIAFARPSRKPLKAAWNQSEYVWKTRAAIRDQARLEEQAAAQEALQELEHLQMGDRPPLSASEAQTDHT